MRDYDPKDWYWTFQNEPGATFSSAVGNDVAANDPALLAFLAGGNTPTSILNRAELGEVLADARVRPADAATGVIDAYKDRHSREVNMQLVAKWMLWATNEIRVLKGQAPVSGAQFRNFLKGLM